MDARTLRRNFVTQLFVGLRVVWPILSGLLLLMAAIGLVIGRIEGWKPSESIYFAYVTGLTIGYGDLAPKTVLTRALSIFIGLCGVVLTGLVAGVAVKAFGAMTPDREQ